MKIRTQGYKVPGTLSDFPVMVTLSNNIGGSGFSYAGFRSPNAYDLRFAESNAVATIPYEIEQWDTNGVSEVWVRVPVVEDTNSFFWAYCRKISWTS